MCVCVLDERVGALPLANVHFMKAALKRMLPPSHVTEDLEQLGLSKEKAAAVGGMVRQRVGNV